MTSMRSTGASIVATICFALTPARAENGIVDARDCYAGTLTTLQTVGTDFYATWEQRGVRNARVAGGPFDRMSSHCVGLVWSSAGVVRGRSACEMVDRENNKVFIESQREGDRGTWRFTGGTGRYTGVTGEGTYLDWGYFPRTSEETYEFCPVSTGRYLIP